MRTVSDRLVFQATNRNDEHPIAQTLVILHFQSFYQAAKIRIISIPPTTTPNFLVVLLRYYFWENIFLPLETGGHQRALSAFSPLVASNGNPLAYAINCMIQLEACGVVAGHGDEVERALNTSGLSSSFYSKTTDFDLGHPRHLQYNTNKGCRF